jgi:threonine aldolase
MAQPADGDQNEPRAHPGRRLTGHPRRTGRDVLLALAETTEAGLEQDHHGAGDVVERLERRIAGMLGFEAAALMPSGTMAQQIALRIWCDRAAHRRVAFHPTCHLELHERFAYRELHGLTSHLLGHEERLFTLEDLEGIPEPVAAILFEFPQREIGGQLPAWDDLVAMTSWARQRNIRLHMDGARLWESKPFYGKEYAEIAELFDSVYVSFYKILGGIAGAALAGPDDVIDEARVWQRRHGGDLIHPYPLALSAELGLDRHLPRMGDYHTKAVEIASVLAELPDVTVTPDPPHTNMMHVFLEGDRERLIAAAARVAEDRDVELFTSPGDSTVPGIRRWELTVGESALEFSADGVQPITGPKHGWFGPLSNLMFRKLMSRFGDKQLTYFTAHVDRTDLEYLGGLLANGTVAPVIEWVYPLERLPEALGHLGDGHALGKLVVTA